MSGARNPGLVSILIDSVSLGVARDSHKGFEPLSGNTEAHTRDSVAVLD